MEKISKARCISDAQIQFISLVDKAANKKSFLITKDENGKASFSAYGRIIKADTESHYVTGIVYEPMTEDAQGDYMTADEIRKAAHWFAKNGSGIDIQHNFEKSENAAVVESWIAKADFEIDGETVKEGTWLITVEISDDKLWEKIEKGEITGFSMGGTALAEKTEKSKKKGLWKSMFEKLGIKKGDVSDDFGKKAKSALFWQSFESLRGVLSRYDYKTDTDIFESDAETITAALTDFSAIVQGILTEPDIAAVISAAVPVQKEETTEKASDDTLKKIFEKLSEISDKLDEQPQKKEAGKDDEMTDIQKFCLESIEKAVEPLYNQRGISRNLNEETVKKSEQHYLHGII